jgi:hypothetical protein
MSVTSDRLFDASGPLTRAKVYYNQSSHLFMPGLVAAQCQQLYGAARCAFTISIWRVI